MKPNIETCKKCVGIVFKRRKRRKLLVSFVGRDGFMWPCVAKILKVGIYVPHKNEDPDEMSPRKISYVFKVSMNSRSRVPKDCKYHKKERK